MNFFAHTINYQSLRIERLRITYHSLSHNPNQFLLRTKLDRAWLTFYGSTSQTQKKKKEDLILATIHRILYTHTKRTHNRMSPQQKSSCHPLYCTVTYGQVCISPTVMHAQENNTTVSLISFNFFLFFLVRKHSCNLFSSYVPFTQPNFTKKKNREKLRD